MISTALNILGSLGIFLFGMKVMSEGIQKTTGNRLRSILAYMTQNRFAGVYRIYNNMLSTVVISHNCNGYQLC